MSNKNINVLLSERRHLTPQESMQRITDYAL